MPTFKSRTFGLLAISVALLCLATADVGAMGDDDNESDEHEISLKEAPEAIRKAFKNVDVDEIEVETEDGQTIYEVVLEIDDAEIELELTADGKLLGVEIEKENSDVKNAAEEK